MIPFGRIMKYGAPEVPKPTYVYTSSEYSNNFSLIYNGNLYLTGSNASYQLGTGNTTNRYNAWARVNESEKVVVCSTGYQQTIYVTNTGKVMLAGVNVLLSAKPNATTFTNVSSYFSSIDMTTVQQINIDRNGVMVVLADGTVWATGTDTTGWSAQGTVSPGYFTLRKIYDASLGKAVTCVCGTGVGRILLEDGTVLSSGNNSAFQCGNSTDANITSWIKTFNGVDPTSIYQWKLSNNMCAIFLANGTYYCTGYGSFGAFGNTQMASTYNAYYQGTLPSNIVPQNMRRYMSLFGSSSGGQTFVVGNDNFMYGTGYRSVNLASTSDLGVFTKCTQTAAGYPNCMYLAGNTNTMLYNPFNTANAIAGSSPQTGSVLPVANVPTFGISAQSVLVTS